MESLSIRKRKRPKPGKSKPSAPHPPAQKHGKKRRKKRKRGEAKVAASLPPEETHKEEKGKGRKKGKSLVARFRTRLEGSQFRCLNEELYTRRSDSAFHLVKQNAALFDIYHKGFQAQVRRWPSNPVHVILQELLKMPKSTRIGDLGCGEAQIAQSLVPKGFRHVWSFDLAKANAYVTVCNIRSVPLKSRALDVVVFCLALMGTDFHDFLLEANRLLDDGGRLVIAEVKSRFAAKDAEESSVAKMDDGIQRFVVLLQHLGFELDKLDKDNQMFVLLHLRKSKTVKTVSAAVRQSFRFKPCIYKRR